MNNGRTNQGTEEGDNFLGACSWKEPVWALLLKYNIAYIYCFSIHYQLWPNVGFDGNQLLRFPVANPNLPTWCSFRGSQSRLEQR